MTSPVAATEGRLDFVPRSAALPDGPAPWRAAWSVPLPITPGRTRLLELGTSLVLVNGPTGITVLGDQPPDGQRELAGTPVVARPGADGAAVLIDGRGRLWRWVPGAAPRPVWETDAPAPQIEAVATGGGDLLVQRPRQATELGGPLRAGWSTELVRPGFGVRWRRPGDLRGVIPAGDSLYVLAEGRQAVARLAVEDGSPRWERPVEGADVSGLLAVVADALWLTTYAGGLLGLDADSGATRMRLTLPTVSVLDGVVDDHGRLRVFTGSRYMVVDLVSGGVTTVAVTPADGEQPSLVFGQAAIPTTDGRLVCFDRDGGVFAVGGGGPWRSRLLWRSPLPLLDCRAGKGSLFVLDRAGTLSALRPPVGGVPETVP